MSVRFRLYYINCIVRRKNMKKRKRSNLFKTALAGTALTLAIGCSAQDEGSDTDDKKKDDTPDPKESTKKTANADDPNIVFIVLDDSGFSDLGAYGSEIE